MHFTERVIQRGLFSSLYFDDKFATRRNCLR